MFNTILTTIQPGGNTIQRVYEWKTLCDGPRMTVE